MTINLRRWHRFLGWALLLPFILWSLTGLFFLVRPAYEDAYKTLLVKSYPQTETVRLPVSESWLEYRFLESILGGHLLVRSNLGWQHLEPLTGSEMPVPGRDQLTKLVDDALGSDRERYGEIIGGDGLTFITDNGVEISLDWLSFTLRQSGRDTYWINQVYDIHYLRFTGIRWFDDVVGVSGLLLLMLMTFTGLRMLLNKSQARP